MTEKEKEKWVHNNIKVRISGLLDILDGIYLVIFGIKGPRWGGSLCLKYLLWDAQRKASRRVAKEAQV